MRYRLFLLRRYNRQKMDNTLEQLMAEGNLETERADVLTAASAGLRAEIACSREELHSLYDQRGGVVG